MIEFIKANADKLLIFTGGIIFTVIITRYRAALVTGTNWVIDSLLALARIYFLMMRRYKKAVIKFYRETKVGYRSFRLDLDRNYISLRVGQFVHYQDKEAGEKLEHRKLEVLEVLKDKQYRHLVILGHAGAGKTTLMQWLLLKCAYGHLEKELGEKLFPIFITLRSLDSERPVDVLVPEVLKNFRFKGDEKYIWRRMEKGKCLLIFDGLDEIKDEITRKKFIEEINGKYSRLYGDSRIIITSRIEDYPKESFPATFRELAILDLDAGQVKDFVEGILEPGDKPGELIRQIEKNVGLKMFVSNPLMLSLLTFVYRESHQKLPDERVKVYNKCMQLMLEDRDAGRGIYEYRNKFDPEDKELLLGKLAFHFSLENKWQYTVDEILDYWK